MHLNQALIFDIIVILKDNPFSDFNSKILEIKSSVLGFLISRFNRNYNTRLYFLFLEEREKSKCSRIKMNDMSERSRFKRPRFVNITPETERLK